MTLELSRIIADSARKAFSGLFEQFPEDFYYCSLVTTGEALAPQISAWSWQALDRAVEGKSKPDMWRSILKWSYADSPYVDYGAEFFGPVRDAFDARPAMTIDMNAQEWEDEFTIRMQAMTEAMQQLSKEGLFGDGSARLEVLVLAEVAPPDSSNTKRAEFLNSKGPALTAWLEEAAEPE